MDFRAQFENDLAAVFHNQDEFSETKEIWYNGAVYEVPAVVSEYNPKDYEGRNSHRNGQTFGDGIYTVNKIVYIPFSALGFLPSINNRIMIDDIEYDITSSELLLGKEIVLILERFDE